MIFDWVANAAQGALAALLDWNGGRGGSAPTPPPVVTDIGTITLSLSSPYSITLSETLLQFGSPVEISRGSVSVGEYQ